MDYEKWRITFQSSEQAAKAAFEESQRWERLFASVIMALVGVGKAAGVRGEDQLNGNLEILIAIEKLKERREKWKARALKAEAIQIAIDEMPAESLKALCVDQQQQGCLRVSEELRNGPIDWNKFGDHPREQAANVAILVGNQIRRDAGGGV